MPQPINLPPETSRKYVAGRIIHVGEWVMNWKGSRECAAPRVALWDGCGWLAGSTAQLPSGAARSWRDESPLLIVSLGPFTGMFTARGGVPGLAVLPGGGGTRAALISPVISLIRDSKKTWTVPVALRELRSFQVALPINWRKTPNGCIGMHPFGDIYVCSGSKAGNLKPLQMVDESVPSAQRLHSLLWGLPPINHHFNPKPCRCYSPAGWRPDVRVKPAHA